MNKTEQIAQMQKEIDTLVKEVSDSKSKEASAKSSQDTWYKAYNEDHKEIEQLHTLLDYLPNSVPKLNEDGYTNKSAVLRLSVWLAQRS